MSKKDLEQDYEMQGQWLFVVLGTLLAFFAGIGINAAYSLLKYYAYSDWYILVLGIVLSVFFADAIGYMLNNIQYIRDNPETTLWSLLRKYFKHRVWPN